MNKVQGIEAMKRIRNQTVSSGMPLPLRIFDYSERTAQNAQKPPATALIDTDGYITREEFESRITAITAQIKESEENAE